MTTSFPARRCMLAAAACLAVAAIGEPTAEAATETAVSNSASAGRSYIESQQSSTDGTFNPGFSSFDPTATALAAAGRNAADVARGGSASLQDAIFNALNDASNANHPTEVGAFENALLSGYSAGIDTARISPSENLVADLAATYTGGYFGDPTTPFAGFNNVTFGTLALNGLPAPKFLVDRSVEVIRQNQHTDGGWNSDQSITADTQAAASDVDLTGATIAALCGGGVRSSDRAVSRGVDFLKANYDPTSGGFRSFGTANTNTTGFAVSGLKACGIDPQGPGFDGAKTPLDYLIDRQGASNGAGNGSFEYSDPPNPFVPDGPNLPASRDAVRALGGAAAFAAAPPARANPALPRTRPVPTAPTGTTVPVALAVDDGAGGVTFCRVSIPSGSSLASVLATANGASTPGGCATGGEFTGGQLSKLNGQSGSWSFSVDGSTEEPAADQTIGFGDFVALRRTAATAATPVAPPAQAGQPAAPPVPAATQARTTPARVASKSLKASRKKRVATVSLTCAKANRLCQGTVYLVYKKRTLARRAFLIAGGKTTRLNVKLSKAAIRRVGRSKRIKVNVFSRDGNGIASTTTRTVTLRTAK